MVRIVDVDQRGQADARPPISEHLLVEVGLQQEWAWVIGEQVVLAFDLHDVGVLGDRPERPVPGLVDPGHRCVGPHLSQCLVQPGLVGIGLWLGQHPCGGV